MNPLLDHRIPPPVVVLGFGALMWAAAPRSPSFVLQGPWALALAVGCALVGVGLLASGFMGFRRAGTTIDPTRPGAASSLVTGGIYRITRNPMYVGMTLVLAGWAVFLQSWWALLGPVAFVSFITVFQIRPEEQALRAKFGASFDAYAAQVRRWL